ncbi:60S ribosomal protein L23A [Exophiala sideris]|uniref:60S ribosomal protein L23A n=1 Tax=Exophiala sideris TaxID=1016849 RepID=A0ABR0JGN1_9EURO|nr:60S ribosomal protein L23A [Exophiala sideris]KAK5063863.1 60S ribosomal protein L23A [Exophiala sideris]
MSKRGRGGASGNKLKMTLGLPVYVYPNPISFTQFSLPQPRSRVLERLYVRVLASGSSPGLVET